jgi:hypothetical protein
VNARDRVRGHVLARRARRVEDELLKLANLLRLRAAAAEREGRKVHAAKLNEQADNAAAQVARLVAARVEAENACGEDPLGPMPRRAPL